MLIMLYFYKTRQSLALLFLVTLVSATPAWNKVNSVHVNGTQCGLPTYYSYPCPSICVRDITQCPLSIRPAPCPANQTYCIDGQCRSSCPTDLQSSLCACPGQPFLQVPLYACQPQYVNIPQFTATNKTKQAMAVCGSALNLSSLPDWTPDNSLGIMWGVCPAPDYGTLTFYEPVFLAMWVYYGSLVAFLMLWLAYKTIREKVIKLQYIKTFDSYQTKQVIDEKKKDSKLADVHSIEPEEEMVIKAYKRDILGIVFFGCYILQTLGMVAFMIMIVYDYYQNYLWFRGSAVVQSSTFIGQWYVFFIWFACLTIFKNRIMNFYRIQCTYAEGHYVQIEKIEPAIILLEENDKMTDSVRWLEDKGKRLFGLDVVVTTATLNKTRSGTKYFNYQCTRFVYHPESQLFTPHDFHLGETHDDLARLDGGLSVDEAAQREELVGPNFINVHVPNVPMAFLREFSSFFYIYQFTALWLFYYFAYWQVGVADTAVILLSAIVKVVVRLKSEHRIKQMAEFTDQCQIKRDGTWQTLSTADLVPGDVFEVVEGKTTPCDAVILTGNIVVDESSLTGEPLPIRKFPIRKDDLATYDRMGASKISTIFSGTRISQAERTLKDTPVCALVTRTGTSTDKGELVKKILFPTRVSFVFDEQIKIVILILLCCGLIMLGLAIWLYAKGTSAWFYAMFAICQLVSPLLPAALVVGQSVAAGRLRDKQIYCVDLPRILMAGKVQLFCFDKTGTLTKEGLEFYGVQPVMDQDEPKFDVHMETVDAIPRLAQIALATCHAVTTLNGHFIGNPVDIEMFRSSKWELDNSSKNDDYVDTFVPPKNEPNHTPSPVHILKRFEFVHARMSMSVAVLDTATNKIHIFVKGAYEKIKQVSTCESIPEDYDTVTNNHARQGCYVLGLGHRELDLSSVANGLAGFKKWTRDDMEQQVRMIGLILFKNQLKHDTAENISELKRGATRTIMITGDTALTGIYIARQCGMATNDSRMVLGDVKQGQLVWMDVDDEDKPVDVDTMLLHGTELAVTGTAFGYLVDHDLIRKYLMNIRVFARMTPHGKVQCVQLHMERGITAMTGDGGNDCGALRAAHVGIAMSDAEASIVSPFSTSVRSVKSCVELLRQGRAALATSITGYRYLVLYGQVMMMLKIFTFYFSVTMGTNVWIAIDVFITVLMTWALSQSKAADRLEGVRPTARLLGPQTLASCLGLVAINWIYLTTAFYMLFQQDWFRCNEFDANAVDISKWWLLADNYEAQVLALVCLFQFVNNAAVFNFGYKFRQAFYKNYALVLLWLIYLAILSHFILADTNQMGCLFRINCGSKQVLAEFNLPVPPTHIENYNTPLGMNVMPSEFRWRLWGLCVGNMFTALAYERLVVLGPVHEWLSRKFPVHRLKVVF